LGGLAIACVVIAMIVAAIGFGLLPSPLTSSPSTSVAQCLKPDAGIADPDAPHGLFVLSPPTGPHQPYYSDSVQFLENNPMVCGADFWVHWGDVDQGPNTSTQYNWSSVANEIAPWVSAGKEVNLIFQTVGYGPNQSWIPSYVRSEIATIQCGDSPVTPLFWESPYPQLYQSFIRAAVAHFETTPGIGYLRFGLGTGGETFPLYDVGAPGCEAALNATGFTTANWTKYLFGMLDFERSLAPQVQLMVALNGVFPGIPDNVSASVASRAAQDGIGFGSEGLEESNVDVSDTGAALCRGGYCKLFTEFAGEVPMELQTYSASQPNGSGPTGSLTALLPWALAEHTQIFELYFVDWLTAFDPNYPAYATYHSGYAEALVSAAEVVGEAD
jgi:hypothetical protein